MPTSTGLPTREKHVEIRLSHTEITELIAPRTDAPARKASDSEERSVAAPWQAHQPRLERHASDHELVGAPRGSRST
ncbi:hypothetical protein ACGFY7_45780 [Streptomyces prunicolor]|uniref:hypothetical protein n=1 Tax=Streptomyces prunicolor TaxID=67348 RepID=UPI0037213C0C